MTYIRSTILPNGDVKEIRTNPGAAPRVYINGVLQPIATVDYVKPNWCKWFAWRPVRVNGHWTWLKTVYRYKTNDYVTHDDWPRYEYGTLFDVLANSAK